MLQESSGFISGRALGHDSISDIIGEFTPVLGSEINPSLVLGGHECQRRLKFLELGMPTAANKPLQLEVVYI